MACVVALLSGILLWGLAWWPIQALNAQGMGAVSLTLAAYGMAAVVMLYPALRCWPDVWRARKILLAIAVGGACWNLAFVGAMAEGEAGRRILFYYLSSSWSILGGRLFLGERIDMRRGASLVLAFAGAIVVLGISDQATGGLSWPDALAVLAGLAHATTNLCFRYAEDIPLPSKNGALFLGTALTAAAIFSLRGDSAGPLPMTGAWLAAATFGAAWVLLADSLVQFGVSHMPAARSSVLMLAELPMTVVSAALIVGDRISGAELAGGVLIVGAALNELTRPAGGAAPSLAVPRARRLTPV
jgi:drug/metabolite transporter (DMT)-like permease